MSKIGPKIYIEDDQDDQLFFKEAIEELDIPNEVLLFHKPEDAIEYLITANVAVFAIICDINIPGINGMEFKKMIESNPGLRRKRISAYSAAILINPQCKWKSERSRAWPFYTNY